MPDNKNRPAKEPPFRPPQHEIEAFARCILPAIRTFYDSEEGQRAFADWKEAQVRK